MTDWNRCQEIADKIRESCVGISFLSEVNLDDDDLEFVCENARNISFSNIPSSNILTAYILVYAGREYDGSYWPHLEKLLGMDTNQNDRDILMNSFYEGLNELGLNKENLETPRHIEQILVHTVVPDREVYMNNFFSFISSFYKDVLNFELPDDCSEAFELLSAIVKQEVQSGQFPSPYALNRCTVYALENPDNYDKIMIKILSIIDAGYNGRKVMSLGNNRFATPFNRWYINNIGSRSRNSLRREMEMRRARLILSNGKVKFLIPAMRCSHNANLVIKVGRKTVNEVPVRTFPTKVQGLIIHKMINEVTLDPKELCIDPFGKFQIELDGHSILSSNPVDVLLFNENENRIKTLDVGVNYILVKNADIVPMCTTSDVQRVERNLYICNLKEGDELSIGETHLSVIPSDSSSDRIDITPLENVVATTDMEIIPVCTEFDLLCITTNAKIVSKIYVKITVDDEITYHRPLRVSTNNVNNGVFAARLPRDEHTSFGIHTIFTELYQDNKKVADSKFLLVPGYKYEFDSKRPAYVDETNGKMSYSGPINGIVDFQTSDEYVDVNLPNSNVVLRHIIPAIRIKTGDDKWRSPGQYDMNILDFNGDYLWVSNPCANSLIFNKKPISRHISDDGFIYDFHKMREMYESEDIKNIELEISLESKPRFHFCNIWVCNEYFDVEKEDFVELTMVRHTNNKILVIIPETGESFDFTEEKLIVKKPEYNGYSIIIKEKDPYGTEHVLFNKRYYKKEIYVEKLTDTSCTIFCHDDHVDLRFNKMTVKCIMECYDNKSRYSPWMKKERQKVIDCLKHMGIN